ncbi:hypothetical protein XF24_00880 [candidate division SR1 bacterium Aalborg_AAW-1]|nr:hypothetical protein XF24_00880 [candidate division SR1 bacterium Aalborg_AAW-1]
MIQQHILMTVDGIIFTIKDQSLQVLLIERLLPPFEHMRALPGGYVLDNETLEQAVYREVQEETGVNNAYLEQLYTFSDLDRDPRGRHITCAYMALMRSDDIDLQAGSDATNAKLFPVNQLPELAFDHKKILNYAIQRLKYKLEYTNLVQYLLPESFTLTELYQVYDIVFQQDFDIRNFKKKILKLNIVEPTGEKVVRGVHRPAMLYKFITPDTAIVEIL